MTQLNPKKLAIAELINIEGVTKQEIYDLITVPTDNTMGDYTLPCFRFSKMLRQSPIAIANSLAESLVNLSSPLASCQAVNGYLNFFEDKLASAKSILSAILSQGENYGSSNLGQGKTICIDYSSINIAKPFHIGHLSTTVIGGALYRIYKKLGYNVVGINHLGDWGTQFGKLIVAFKKWGSDSDLKERGMVSLTELYVRYHKEADLDPTLDDLSRFYFKKIEDNDEDAMKLFTLFKEITLNEVQKTYVRLKIKFDSYNGEAFYNDKMQPVLDELESLNLLTTSESAKVVDLTEFGMPPCLLVKADGATLYATRDLAAAFYRKATYDFYKCLYVVAYQQNLHFKQWFKVIELMGKQWDLVHVQFGMVSLEDGTMSTRKGKVVLLQDVLDRAVAKAYDIITVKNPTLADKEEVAEDIGVGAVVFSALSNNRIKDIVFSYDKVLTFDGETGPYIQYTNARCNSILARDLSSLHSFMAKNYKLDDSNYQGVANKEAETLITLLQDYVDVIKDAADKNEPSYISRHLINICQAFNKFYYEHRILDAEETAKASRLALVYCTHIVIESGLMLLGISAPKQM